MSEFEISLLCSSVISYYQVQNGISPIKRLYVRNASDFDCENIEISVSSKPDFLLPVSEIQAVFPARANLRFDGIAKLSPLYMVAQNRKHDGEITVQVLKDGVVLEEATERVTVLAFDECNVDKPESIATFVRRTPDVNRLLNLAHKKIAEWGFKDVTGTGYANASKTKCEISAPRRMPCFATADSLWARKRRRTASSCPIFRKYFRTRSQRRWNLR